MSDSSSGSELTNQIAQHPNDELKPPEVIPEWLRLTKWRILWMIGVLGFIWWTASIYHGHERLLYFSPQSLGVEQQTRIVLLGTSIPIFTSDREPDFSLPLLSDFLMVLRRENLGALWFAGRPYLATSGLCKTVPYSGTSFLP